MGPETKTRFQIRNNQTGRGKALRPFCWAGEGLSGGGKQQDEGGKEQGFEGGEAQIFQHGMSLAEHG